MARVKTLVHNVCEGCGIKHKRGQEWGAVAFGSSKEQTCHHALCPDCYEVIHGTVHTLMTALNRDYINRLEEKAKDILKKTLN